MGKAITEAPEMTSENLIIQIRTPDSSCTVSDQQSVGSSSGRDTCVLMQDTSDGKLSCRSFVMCNASKMAQCTYHKEKVFFWCFIEPKH